MSITPQDVGEVLREKFRTMTRDEFLRIATKYSPSLLDATSEEGRDGPRLLGVLWDEPLGGDALQQMLAAVGIRCTDKEVEPILRLLRRQEAITTAGAFADLAGAGRGAVLYEIFLAHRATNARAFDFVACLADAADAETVDAFTARSLTLLSILDEFDQLHSA